MSAGKSASGRSFVELVTAMAEGNPGAVTAIGQMFTVTGLERTYKALLVLKAYNVTGPRIWLCYKDICKMDAQLLTDKTLTLKMGIPPIVTELVALPYSGYAIPR